MGNGSSMAHGKGRCRWQGSFGLALAAALLVFAVGPAAGSPSASAQTVVTNWRLVDIQHRDVDGRGVQAGALFTDQIAVSERGGQVQLTSRRDSCRTGTTAAWLFKWNFVRDIRTVSKGDTLAVNFSFDTGSTVACGIARESIPEASVAGEDNASRIADMANIPRGPNFLFYTGEPRGPFMADPSVTFHVPGPRLIGVDTRWDNLHGHFVVRLSHRWGFVYEIVYLYDAVTGPPPPAGGNSGSGGGNPGPGGSNPPAGITLGGMDLAGYCRDGGFNGAILNSGAWFCLANDTGSAIDMDGVCQWQYDRVDAYAVQTERNNPLSWLCYAPGR